MGIFYESYGEESELAYPDDMRAIMEYLNAHGRIKCSPARIEDLYYDFSEEEYFAGWMSITSDSGEVSEVGQNLLREFERWLDKQR